MGDDYYDPDYNTSSSSTPVGVIIPFVIILLIVFINAGI